MKISVGFLVLVLSVLAVSGCASAGKKSSENAAAVQNPPIVAPAAVVANPAVTPAVKPAADEVPVAVKRYVSK